MSEEERAEFLAKCDDLFSNRYTDKDPEFARLMAPNSRAQPPVITDWPLRNPNSNWGRHQGHQVYYYPFIYFMISKNP